MKAGEGEMLESNGIQGDKIEMDELLDTQCVLTEHLSPQHNGKLLSPVTTSSPATPMLPLDSFLYPSLHWGNTPTYPRPHPHLHLHLHPHTSFFLHLLYLHFQSFFLLLFVHSFFFIIVFVFMLLRNKEFSTYR